MIILNLLEEFQEATRMKYQIDPQFITDCFEEFVFTPSPVGYYVHTNPLLEKCCKYKRSFFYFLAP
jgi:hypothetical protein